MIEINRVSTADALDAARDLIREARTLGYERLRLGTLTTMHAAQNLYASLGFRPIAPYRTVEFGDTVFYELEIGAPAV